MKKSSVLAKQLEKMESDLRVLEFKNNSNEDRATRAESALEHELTKSRAADLQTNSLQLKVVELGRIQDSLMEDKNSLQAALHKKALEVEEMSKMHITVLGEVGSSCCCERCC